MSGIAENVSTPSLLCRHACRDRSARWLPASIGSRGNLMTIPVPMSAGAFDWLRCGDRPEDCSGTRLATNRPFSSQTH